MDTPKRNPEEIKDRLSAELEASLAQRQALIDDASSVFTECTKHEDCADNDPAYLEGLTQFQTTQSAFDEARQSLPENLSHMKEMDADEVLDTFSSLMDDSNAYSAMIQSDRTAISALNRAAGRVNSAQRSIDNLRRKSGGIRKIAKIRQQLAKPDPKKLEAVAKQYGEICDLIDNNTSKVDPKTNWPTSYSLAKKVEDFNHNNSSWILSAWLAGNGVRHSESLVSLRNRATLPIDSHSNNGINVRLSTKLDGWFIDLTFSEAYMSEERKEAEERHAINLAQIKAENEDEGPRDTTRTRVGDVYGSSSSPGREKA